MEWRALLYYTLQYKHSGTFANRKYEELCYPKKSIQSWKCDPIQRYISISLL